MYELIKVAGSSKILTLFRIGYKVLYPVYLDNLSFVGQSNSTHAYVTVSEQTKDVPVDNSDDSIMAANSKADPQVNESPDDPGEY